MIICRMLSTLVVLSLQVAVQGSVTQPLAILNVLNGGWSVTPTAATKPDQLVNHCSMSDAFYTCEQVVNGNAVALIVFTATDVPGAFHTKIVLPTGYSIDRGDLKIDGDHWTWSGKSTSDDGKTTTYSRTENYFTGKDKIRFERYESTDGTTWVKKGGGDEVRISGS
jgi:hypothetical protein